MNERIPRVPLAVGDTTVSLPTLDVLQQSIVRTRARTTSIATSATIFFDAFAETSVNFRDMAFLLR